MTAISALAPWFGSNRTLAANVGAALEGCRWVGVPFAGGMCELKHIEAKSIVAADKHSHIVNLAMVAAEPTLNLALRNRLADLPFHPTVLARAQIICRDRERIGMGLADMPSLDWAVDYFVCSWMGRNGCAGTKNEFGTNISVRWDDGGGDSAIRFRNATTGLAAWQSIMARCTFVVLDVFDFLARVVDREKHGLYLDPPFIDVGDSYKHPFTEEMHEQLAAQLNEGFHECVVACRFYDHPLMRKLYPEEIWEWNRYEGRRQTNEVGPEVLLVKRRRTA